MLVLLSLYNYQEKRAALKKDTPALVPKLPLKCHLPGTADAEAETLARKVGFVKFMFVVSWILLIW